MDGFHLPKAALDSFEDPKLAHSRRGAHWTFDSTGFVNLIKLLPGAKPVTAPSFDHSIGDPVPNAIVISGSTKLILVEGLYTILSTTKPWSDLNSLWSETWLIKSKDANLTAARLAQRHVSSGLEPDLAGARNRILINDSLNADFLLNDLPENIDVTILN
ncbi:putative uridine kinase [Smittium mucronatum]|uniref:Putative uridine kinase n=1 Tax=Smittium mucronatum TaxID=133383 RepID=A0A1R0GTT4_9FUNG|nr:putative uridine kinase [Smittium mucronatum]